MQSIINSRKFLAIGMLVIIGCLTSCLKDKNSLTNLSGQSTNAFIEIPGGGLGSFAASALNFTGTAPDTLIFYVNLASKETLNKDVTVSLDYDVAALTAYNGGGGIQYTKFPDSIFSFTQKQAVIKAGQRVASVMLIVFPGKVDPTKNYMLPISVKDAQGTLISGNFGTIYYHLIGNPLAGSYNWDFTRWNNSDGSGAPNSLSFTAHSSTLAPISPTDLEVASGYFIQPRYEISFTNVNGTISNFKVILNAEDVKAMVAGGVTITDGPNILIADPLKKEFKFQYAVATATASRYIIDRFYK
jgi:hypothetical protein